MLGSVEALVGFLTVVYVYLPVPQHLYEDDDDQEQEGKPGRNDRCPCGSGRKYKNCCMRKMGAV